MKKKRRKKPQWRIYRDKADDHFADFVKLVETDHTGWGKCVTCGKPVHFEYYIRSDNTAQCGHFTSRGWIIVRFYRPNAHLQCCACNSKHIGDDKSAEYRIYMKEFYGQEIIDKIDERVQKEKCGEFKPDEAYYKAQMEYWEGRVKMELLRKYGTDTNHKESL